MKYLLTGASGFLGSYLFKSLSKENEIFTLGRNQESDIRALLTAEINLSFKFSKKIDSVIHCAGLAHQESSFFKKNDEFMKVNFFGTKNLCDWIDKWKYKPKSFIFISTVAVYGLETGKNICEKSELKGKTPYALSKILAEKFLKSWGEKNSINVLILRLPLIVGVNPKGNLRKMINAIKSNKYFSIDGGRAKKSMIHVDDIYNFLKVCKFSSGIFNLTDGCHPSFNELENAISKKFNKPSVRNIPLWLAYIIGFLAIFIPYIPLSLKTVRKITNDLTFSDRKARYAFNWKSISVIKKINESQNI